MLYWWTEASSSVNGASVMALICCDRIRPLVAPPSTSGSSRRIFAPAPFWVAELAGHGSLPPDQVQVIFWPPVVQPLISSAFGALPAVRLTIFTVLTRARPGEGGELGVARDGGPLV
jgi:hypothetical protein